MHPTDLYTIANIDRISLDKLSENFNFNVKSVETNTIRSLLAFLKSTQTPFRADEIFFDFHIPNINKEFDILKITSQLTLNLELKSEKVTHERMETQLKHNKFYLSKIFKEVRYFTYYESENKIYELINDKLTESSAKDLIQCLNLPAQKKINIEEKFSPEQFLVSPFNDTNKFLNKEYLFTTSQNSFKNNIMDSSKNVILLGNPGTGKTLLAYDIASDYQEHGQKVLIYHGARLNDGHRKLNNNGFNIKSIKAFNSDSERDKYDILILDEVQRFGRTQIDDLLNTFHGKIILSGDPKQILNTNGEFGKDIDSEDKLKIFIQEKDLLKVKLSTKVRTNKYLSEFIVSLTDKKHIVQKNNIKKENISFEYFTSELEASDYLNQIDMDKTDKSKILSLPNSIINEDLYTKFQIFENSFDIIGQEFDSVTLIIGPNISYGPHGKLKSSITYYDSALSLVQNITRTRKNLNLVILNNKEILNRILEIL